MKSYRLLLAVGLFTQIAHAIPEANYATDLAQKVAPFFSGGRAGTFQGQAGAQISYIYFYPVNAKATVVISSGYGENWQKYQEVAYDFVQQGFGVFLFDHRGQGNSTHLLPDIRKGYVDDFDYFATDLKNFVETVVKPHSRADQPRYLLAHSMGGLIAANYLEKYPEDFAKAILNAPMIQMQLGGKNSDLAIAELIGLTVIGQGEDKAPGTAEQDPTTLPFAQNTATHSAPRYQMKIATLLQNPTVYLTTVTNLWVLRNLIGGKQTLHDAAEVTTPLMLFQAGQDDYVDNGLEQKFCAAAAHCQLKVFADARHEILMEQDSIRDIALATIFAFFTN